MFRSKASRTASVIITIILCIVLVVVLVELFVQHPEELSYDEFFKKLGEGKIKSVYVEGNYKMNVLYVQVHLEQPGRVRLRPESFRPDR